ncbi:MAG: hypothetical protein JXR48_01060 [Candidatus Delongbacteria bacterium]|nr:hypothetical protein [Candidatus Delongbacteria bacterium]MBN2833532.1 hypothetical protein [Candidatus Delongbacteria bacterium]
MKKEFSPLSFLSSLGAGGISVLPFAFFQYTHHQGKGLITFNMINHTEMPALKQLLFYSMEAVMVVFVLLHIILTIKNLYGLVKWYKTESYYSFINDPLKNAGFMAIFISLAMTLNTVIGPIRFFVPIIAKNLQNLMLPALAGILILGVITMYWQIKLLKISFVKSFDVNKINFGWLLQPFALAMVGVTASGIAAMAKTPDYAHIAAFFSITIASMALFLLIVKLISIFKSHFASVGLPAKQFMPSYLIVIPIITLLGITGFRLVHYFENNFGFHIDFLATLIVVVAFAFETWYLLFGLALLKNYLKTDFREKEYYVSQWGLVCPFVAFSVLGAFFYKLFVPNMITYGVIIISAITAIVFFFVLLNKQMRYSNQPLK